MSTHHIDLDALLDAIVADIIALSEELPADDKASDRDRFTLAGSAGDDELESLARDRQFVVYPVQGPTPTGTRCRERFLWAFAAGYLARDESLHRMLRDSPLVRERVRTLHHRIAGVFSVRLDVSSYDSQTLEGAVVHAFAFETEHYVQSLGG